MGEVPLYPLTLRYLGMLEKEEVAERALQVSPRFPRQGYLTHKNPPTP